MKTLIRMITTLAIGLFLSTQVYADSRTAFIDESLRHADLAVTPGKEDNVKELLMHAKESLGFAKQAANEKGQTTHIVHGIKHLEDGIKQGEAGNADAATKHIEEAITHLHAAENIVEKK